jgi:hypothetical protein
VVRPYTPISTENTRGHFDLIIKRYDAGNISKCVFAPRIFLLMLYILLFILTVHGMTPSAVAPQTQQQFDRALVVCTCVRAWSGTFTT